jgi:cytochrome c oxidase subunit 2
MRPDHSPRAHPSPRRRLLFGMASGLALVTLTRVAPAAAAPRVIEIVAKKFDFVPDEIHLALGEPVILQLSAPDVPMGFALADFGLRADAVPGLRTTLAFTPDKAGRFIFVCDVFCGSGHEDMSGVLIVG